MPSVEISRNVHFSPHSKKEKRKFIPRRNTETQTETFFHFLYLCFVSLRNFRNFSLLRLWPECFLLFRVKFYICLFVAVLLFVFLPLLSLVFLRFRASFRSFCFIYKLRFVLLVSHRFFSLLSPVLFLVSFRSACLVSFFYFPALFRFIYFEFLFYRSFSFVSVVYFILFCFLLHLLYLLLHFHKFCFVMNAPFILFVHFFIFTLFSYLQLISFCCVTFSALLRFVLFCFLISFFSFVKHQLKSFLHLYLPLYECFVLIKLY